METTLKRVQRLMFCFTCFDCTLAGHESKPSDNQDGVAGAAFKSAFAHERWISVKCVGGKTNQNPSRTQDCLARVLGGATSVCELLLQHNKVDFLWENQCFH